MMNRKMPSSVVSFGFGFGWTVIVPVRVLFFRPGTKNIPPFLIESCIDVSHLCNQDDVLLLSNDLKVLQNTVDIVCSCLNEIGLQVTFSKTELLIYGLSQPPPVTINVDPVIISVSSSEFRVLFAIKYKMEIQHSYSPSKSSMARDTRGIQKKIQYKQQPKKGTIAK